MKTLEMPFVPESLQPYANEDFLNIVDRYAGQTLDDIVRQMPEYESYNRYKTGEPSMGAVLYRPRDFDPRHAVVVPYPFGNGHSPHMHIRTHLTQKVLGNKVQILAFPNNTTDQRFYGLNEQQRAQIANGDAEPLAAGILGTADALGLESIDILGYSQGAFIGAAVMKLARKRGQLQVKHALIAEPPNVLDRTPKELKKAFLATGLGPLVKAVRDSSIPALTEAQGMIGLGDKHRLMLGMLRALKNSKLPDNQALHTGMAHNNLAETLVSGGGDVFEKNETPVITLARAEKSKVTPYFDGAFVWVAAHHLVIKGYGHEAADNVAGVSALLAKAALIDTIAPHQAL